MPSELMVLDSAEVLEVAIATSEERLVLLFKHSVTCGTSAQAYDELVDHLSTGQHTTQYVIVTVRHIGICQMLWPRGLRCDMKRRKRC